MNEVISREIKWGDQVLSIETGKVAKQATASTIVRYGETVVMANVTAAKQAKPDIDFFPLTVNYQEKFYAAGKIPGGFFKREGRPTEYCYYYGACRPWKNFTARLHTKVKCSFR